MLHEKCITVKFLRLNNFDTIVCTYTQKVDISDPITKMYLTLFFSFLMRPEF